MVEGLEVLSIQALALAQVVDLRGADVAGKTYVRLQRLVRSVSAPLRADRPLFEDIPAVGRLLRSDRAQQKLLAPRSSCSSAAGGDWIACPAAAQHQYAVPCSPRVCLRGVAGGGRVMDAHLGFPSAGLCGRRNITPVVMQCMNSGSSPGFRIPVWGGSPARAILKPVSVRRKTSFNL